MTTEQELIGKKVLIQAEITEHLVLGKKEWLTVRLPNDQKITLRRSCCTETDGNFLFKKDTNI